MTPAATYRPPVPPEAVAAVRAGESVAAVARRLHVDYPTLWRACRAAGLGRQSKPRLACTAEGCDRKVSCKGLCARHYWAANWRDYPSGQKRLAGVKRDRTSKNQEQTP